MTFFFLPKEPLKNAEGNDERYCAYQGCDIGKNFTSIAGTEEVRTAGKDFFLRRSPDAHLLLFSWKIGLKFLFFSKHENFPKENLETKKGRHFERTR